MSFLSCPELIEFREITLGSELGEMRRIHFPATVLDDDAVGWKG